MFYPGVQGHSPRSPVIANYLPVTHTWVAPGLEKQVRHGVQPGFYPVTLFLGTQQALGESVGGLAAVHPAGSKGRPLSQAVCGQSLQKLKAFCCVIN